MTVISQNRIDNARSLLKRARKDYQGFVRVVGREYLRHGKGPPQDPALAVYLLQQSAEKTVKAIAIASGRFNMDDFSQVYRHNSLYLYCEFFLEISNSPFAPVFDLMARIHPQGVKSIQEFQHTLEQIKQNIGRGQRPPDAPDWWLQYQTESPQQIDAVMDALLSMREQIIKSSHQKMKSRMRFGVEKLEDYRLNPSAQNFLNLISSSFRELPNLEQVEAATSVMSKLTEVTAGVNLQEYFKQSPPVTQTVSGLTKKSHAELKRAMFDKLFLSGWAIAALSFLSAFTFPHEATTRYPEDIVKKSSMGQRQIIDCDSYSEILGIVSCMPKVGRVTSLILSDVADFVESVSSSFSLIDTLSSK